MAKLRCRRGAARSRGEGQGVGPRQGGKSRGRGRCCRRGHGRCAMAEPAMGRKGGRPPRPASAHLLPHGGCCSHVGAIRRLGQDLRRAGQARRCSPAPQQRERAGGLEQLLQQCHPAHWRKEHARSPSRPRARPPAVQAGSRGEQQPHAGAAAALPSAAPRHQPVRGSPDAPFAVTWSAAASTTHSSSMSCSSRKSRTFCPLYMACDRTPGRAGCMGAMHALAAPTPAQAPCLATS